MPVPQDADARVALVDGSSGISMTDQVYALLKEEILRVDRKPGDLLGEAELAERYHVSKTPVREALRLLARDGWVVVLPRRGYLIRPIKLEDVREIFGMRLMMEPHIAMQAARLVTEDDLVQLRASIEAQTNAAELGEALYAARRFHAAVAEVLGNVRILRTLLDLLDEVRRLHFLLPGVESHITSQEELRAHRQLVTALADGDSARAGDIMREHLNEVARTLVRGFGGV